MPRGTSSSILPDGRPRRGDRNGSVDDCITAPSPAVPTETKGPGCESTCLAQPDAVRYRQMDHAASPVNNRCLGTLASATIVLQRLWRRQRWRFPFFGRGPQPTRPFAPREAPSQSTHSRRRRRRRTPRPRSIRSRRPCQEKDSKGVRSAAATVCCCLVRRFTN
jgi:hypothetical protein